MLPWMSFRSRGTGIAFSPLEGARWRPLVRPQQVPKLEEFLLEKIRGHVWIVGDEVGEGRLHRNRSQDVLDRRAGLVAEIEHGLDLALAQIVGELVLAVLGGKLVGRRDGKRHATAEHVANRG